MRRFSAIPYLFFPLLCFSIFCLLLFFFKCIFEIFSATLLRIGVKVAKHPGMLPNSSPSLRLLQKRGFLHETRIFHNPLYRRLSALYRIYCYFQRWCAFLPESIIRGLDLRARNRGKSLTKHIYLLLAYCENLKSRE